MKFSTWLASLKRPIEQVLAEQFAFGNRETMFEFLDLPLNHLIHGELQHGYATAPALVAQSSDRKRKKNGLLYPFYVWSDLLNFRMKKMGHESCFSIAAPWALIVNAYENGFIRLDQDFSFSEQKIVYFPTHSYHGMISTSVDLNSLNQSLSRFNRNDISVCLYWLDFLSPDIRQRYIDLGFKEIVCLGYRGSPSGEFPWVDIGGRVKFNRRLLNLLTSSSLVICDEVSTAFWAACSLGKEVFVTLAEVPIEDYWSNKLRKLNNFNLQRIKETFGNESTFPFREIVNSGGFIQNAARENFGWDKINETSQVLKTKESKILSEIYF